MYGDSEETDFYEYTGNNDSVVCAYFDYDEYISKEIWDTLHEKDGDEYVYEKHENEIKDSVKLWFSETLCGLCYYEKPPNCKRKRWRKIQVLIQIKLL
jgi:hypothetical protein